MTLRVTNFGGGVVLAGSPDERNTNELLAAESVDIGARGTLICASDVSSYVRLSDDDAGFYERLYAVFTIMAAGFVRVIAVGEAVADGSLSFVWSVFNRTGQTSPVPLTGVFELGLTPLPGGESGAVVTNASFPGKFLIKESATPPDTINVHLVNVGAREGFAPITAPGLYVLATIPPVVLPFLRAIKEFDALGTGPEGSLPVAGGSPGTKSKQLYFRGIVTYNNHTFGWGFDSKDDYGDGPNRIMFCNNGNPLKWGNDQGDIAVDRDFADSDAIVLGDAGEIIRGAIKWNGRLWFGTNQQLHWIAGYGRDSFITDGAHPVAKSYNIIGPHALVEGPDRKLYGWCDQGLWSTADGELFTPLFARLRDFAGRSTGYFDCVWTDVNRDPDVYPGRTNQDLCWMAVDWERRQVIMGIPWCNAVTGSGFGTDTVIVKFHPDTGGFTRQLFLGVQYTAAGYFRAEGQHPAVTFWGTANGATSQIQRFGYKASNATSPTLAKRLPHIEAGPFMPYGGDGDGTLQAVYLSLAWEKSSSLPIVFRISVIADSGTLAQMRLFIQPTRPLAVNPGDLWLDTSQSDNNLGNGASGPGVPARGGYLLKERRGFRWYQVPGGGDVGTRVSVRLAFPRVTATRYSFDVQTVSAAGRFQIESIGLNPGSGSAEGGAG